MSMPRLGLGLKFELWSGVVLGLGLLLVVDPEGVVWACCVEGALLLIGASLRGVCLAEGGEVQLGAAGAMAESMAVAVAWAAWDSDECLWRVLEGGELRDGLTDGLRGSCLALRGGWWGRWLSDGDLAAGLGCEGCDALEGGGFANAGSLPFLPVAVTGGVVGDAEEDGGTAGRAATRWALLLLLLLVLILLLVFVGVRVGVGVGVSVFGVGVGLSMWTASEGGASDPVS
jgi:hypothetical protein